MKNYQILVLADSIASSYKMEYKYLNYPNLLADKLNKSIINYWSPGRITSDMLKSINHKKIKYDIENAEIIIISIGGNHILVPILNAVTRALSLGPPCEKTASELKESLKNNKLTIPLIIVEIFKKQTKEDFRFYTNKFYNDFIDIIRNIKNLNKDAVIIVQTIYNPLYLSEEYEIFSKLLDKYTAPFNEFIISSSNVEEYEVADIYYEFKTYSGDKDLTNINKYKDVHLTKDGHEFVCDILYNLIMHYD